MIGQHICIVVPVLLRPDPTSPNTACIGVIVKCDATGYYGFRVVKDDEEAEARIAGFFSKYGRANFEQAVRWASQDIGHAIEMEKTRPGAFANLIRPRENVVRYDAARTVRTDDPEAELDRQYEQLVR